MAQTQVQNKRGEWVPAIPEPLFIGPFLAATQCECGEKFYLISRDVAVRRYREHYALVHILGLD